MLMVEHDMSLIMGLCTQITVIDFGRVICMGDAATVQADARVIEAYLGAPTVDQLEMP
jgi:branched-chain amino acid transport system ATP-binding protein